MKKSLKMFFAGMLVMALITGLALSGISASQNKSIDISFGDIKIVVDGKKIEPKDGAGNPVEPFIYDGTTYLPVRAVGSAVGKDVSWDAGTKTVYLGKAASANEYSRSNPAPIGTAQSTHYEDYLREYDARVQILSSIRGAEAWAKIKEANMFNTEPAAGKEYVLVEVSATLTNIKDDKAVDLSMFNFKSFNEKNVEYPTTIVVEPKPNFSGQVYSNGTLKGYLAFMVDNSDPAPKAVFGANYDGTGGIWFNLTK